MRTTSVGRVTACFQLVPVRQEGVERGNESAKAEEGAGRERER